MAATPVTRDQRRRSTVAGCESLDSRVPPGALRVWNPLRWPLCLRVILGVATGATVGATFGDREIAFGWTNADLGTTADLYLRLLTTMVTPLIFFAVADAFVQTEISGRQGLKMFLICTINVAVAFTIGLTILNVWQPGRTWQTSLTQLAAPSLATIGPKTQALSEKAAEMSLSPLELIKSHVPASIAAAVR